jgi:type IV secretory pathway VirD2 relaxase
LRDWQRSGDQEICSVILSPEGPLDLKAFTRAWVERVEREHHWSLDWVAAVHTNTEHSHVHIVFREKDRAGKPVRFTEREMHGQFRQHAREVATEFLGYRAGRNPERERNRQERGKGSDRGKSK